MQGQPQVQNAAQTNAMSLLFARYVAGQIEDTSWNQCMQILDANDTSPEERLALAAYFNDAFSEQESIVPKTRDLQAFLMEIRHTR